MTHNVITSIDALIIYCAQVKYYMRKKKYTK